MVKYLQMAQMEELAMEEFLEVEHQEEVQLTFFIKQHIQELNQLLQVERLLQEAEQ